MHAVPFRLLASALALWLGPCFGLAHGPSGSALGFDVSIVVDSRFIEVTADIDLPPDFTVELRNQIDVNHDYQVRTPDEQQRLLWLLQAGEGPLTIRIGGKAVPMAPLYNPQLLLSTRDSASLRSRGKIRVSWFGYTPPISSTDKLELRIPLWSSHPAHVHVRVNGEQGLRFEGGPGDRTFKLGESRRFEFTAKTSAKGFAPSQSTTKTNGNRMIPANAVQLAEALTRHYSYLLPREQRSKVANIHRRLRMGIQRAQFRRRADAETTAALNTASAELVDLLESCPEAVRIKAQETPPLSEVKLPGDAGAVLVRIENGTGPHHGRIYDRSFDIGEFREPLNAGIITRGTTWIMARINDLPADPTYLKVAMKIDGQTKLIPLRLHSPKAARLKLTVLSDDNGKPVPAMVSLRWRTCNLDRRPATAIDLVPQFQGQGRQTSLRTPRLTGDRGKGFWVVPKPFNMKLPPGEWEVTIRRGTEHAVVTETFQLQPGEQIEKTYRPKRWINMPQRGWWSGDNHVHSRILSDDDANNLLAYLAAEDIYLANIVKMGDINRTFFQQRGHGKQYRVADGLRVLSPGQECPRTHEQLGHTLAMNTKTFIRDTSKYYLYDLVFDEAHRQGGLSGYAHVNRDLFFVHRDMSMNIPRGKVDFGEILQFGYLGTDLYYEFLNLGYKLTASAGSDLPWGGTIGEVRVYAYLGDRPFTADNWFAAFGRGRTFVTSGPMLDLNVEGALPGDELELERDREVKVNARLSIDPALGAANLELVAHGKVVKQVNGQGVGDSEIAFETTVPIQGGAWIALRGKAADGSVAHTTPIYVTRNGIRFWNADEVKTLIKKRLGQLDEIEQIVAEARQSVKEGASPALIEIHELAKQGNRLLERVRLARENYADLLRTYENEMSRR